MDDEEDDVFEPDPWRTTFREIKCEDRGTQTPGPVLAPTNGMLPCGVAEEPRPLFYGYAGFRLHFPAHFELVGDQEARPQGSEEERNGMEQRPRQHPVARSMEACIGQKLQLIGDQFHREHLQLYHRNQRNQGPLLWRLATALLSLLFDRGFIAGGGGAGRRWEGLPLTSVFIISMRNWTPNGTVKSITGLLWGGERKERQRVTAGRRQPTFIQGRVFFFPRRCHDAPRFLHRTMFIFFHVWCSSFVQYIVLVKVFALHNVSIFNDLHRPWECLIQCVLPEWVLRNFYRQDEMVRKWKEMWCEVFFSEVSRVTSQVDLLISKEATTQNKAFCTSPQWNIYLFFLFCCFPFLFSFFTPPFSLVWY